MRAVGENATTEVLVSEARRILATHPIDQHAVDCVAQIVSHRIPDDEMNRLEHVIRETALAYFGTDH